MVRMTALILLWASVSVNVLAKDETGMVSGVVKLRGESPKRRDRKIDCPKCAALYPQGQPAEDLVLDKENNLRWAFVYVKEGLGKRKYDPPKEPAVLEQKGCRYNPHVMGIQVGQELLIRNGDDHEHCIHALAFENREFNLHQKEKGAEDRKKFDRPEVPIRLKDDAHVWMAAWVGVLEHPFFAVTGEDGKFEIRGLLPGKYTVEVWQEKCNRVTQTVEIKGGDSKALDFALELRKD